MNDPEKSKMVRPAYEFLHLLLRFQLRSEKRAKNMNPESEKGS